MSIRTVGIVGAGQMGAGIAHVAALSGFDVILTDLETEVLEHGLASIDHNLDRQIKSGIVDAADKKLLTPAELAEPLIPAIVRSHNENRGILRAALVESIHDPLFPERAAKFVYAVAVSIAEHITPTAKRKDDHVANVLIELLENRVVTRPCFLLVSTALLSCLCMVTDDPQ